MIQKQRRLHSGRAAALCLVLLALGVLLPSRVLGHAELVSSDPAANAVLPESPPAMTLVFSEAIDAPSASVTPATRSLRKPLAIAKPAASSPELIMRSPEVTRLIVFC